MLLPVDTTQHAGKNLQQLKTCNSPSKVLPAEAPSNFVGGGKKKTNTNNTNPRIYSIQTQATSHSPDPAACRALEMAH